MEQDVTCADAREVARARAQEILLRYPDLRAEELAWLLDWFGRKASAMDVAMLASEDQVAVQYARFKADHLSKFGMKDLRNAALFVAVFVGIPVVSFMLWAGGAG